MPNTVRQTNKEIYYIMGETKGKVACKMFESSLYYDPQMAKPARFCPSCGSECYAPSLICIRCERR